jgi:hypothetical protein
LYLVAANENDLLKNIVILVYEDGEVLISCDDLSGGGYCYFNSCKGNGYNDIYGWNPDFNGVANIGGNLIGENPYIENVGFSNDKLSGLFSTTPNFENVSKYYLRENNNFKELLTPTGSLEITKAGTYDIIKYAEITIKDTGTPVTVTTAPAMEALLIEENKGKIFLYTGEDTEVYKKGKMYIVEEI